MDKKKYFFTTIKNSYALIMGLTTHLLKRKGSYKKNKNPIPLMGYTTQFIEKESKISHLFIFIHSIAQITINHKIYAQI